jgi:DNA-3-methyladenine glycosylase II
VADIDDPIAIHARFLDLAAEIAAPLAEALTEAGPVNFADREDKGLGYFLSRVVIGQQLSTKASSSIWQRIESAALSAGTTIPTFFGHDCVDTLTGCGVSTNKIKTLCRLRDADQRGLLCSHTLRELDHATRSQKLLAIWGIGQWTCDMASISYCRCPDVWPEGDVTVQKTFSRLIGRRKPSKTAGRFTPYRSYLALSMWRIADAAP